MAIIDSLLVALGYEFDDEDAKKFEKANEVLSKSILVVATAAVAAATAIAGWAVTSADASNETAKLARNARLAVDEFDALAFAAGQTEIEGGTLANGLEQLAIRASEAARGLGSGVEAFGLLGIQATDANGAIKETDQLLLEAADALNGLEDQGQRLELADKLGLKDLNLLLLEGSEGINRLTNEAKSLGVVTAEDAKAAEQFIDEWARFVRVITQVGRAIATKILPVITKLVEGVREFIKDNEELMSSGLVSWFMDLSNVLRFVAAAAIALMGTKLLFWVFKMIKAVKALGAAGLIANAKLLLIPIAMAAAFAALVVIIEDVIAFFQGKKSVTGIIVDSFNEMWDDLNKGLDEWIKGFEESIQKTIKDVQDFFKPLTDLASSISDSLSFESTNNGIMGGTAADIAQSVGRDASTTNNNNSSSSNSNKTEIGQVVVQIDGGNPEEVRRVVQETLSGEIQQATTSLGSAVAG